MRVGGIKCVINFSTFEYHLSNKCLVSAFELLRSCIRVLANRVLATFIFSHFLRASLVAQMLKNLPVMQETQVQSLGWKDPLEKGMSNHSSILAWIEEPGGLQPMGS